MFSGYVNALRMYQKVRDTLGVYLGYSGSDLGVYWDILKLFWKCFGSVEYFALVCMCTLECCYIGTECDSFMHLSILGIAAFTYVLDGQNDTGCKLGRQLCDDNVEGWTVQCRIACCGTHN